MKSVRLQDEIKMEIRKAKRQGRVKESESDIFLKKHVGLIHCENKLSLIQRKICNILLFNALDRINENDIHEIPLKKLCSLIGYNSNDSRQIKDAVTSLMSTVLEWNLLDDNKSLNPDEYSEDEIIWNASSLLAGASIKKGTIKYSYSPQMKSVLSSLDIYGRINLFVQAKFNSTYSLVLYENCVRFKNIKQTSWFPMDVFRPLMGVPEGKYPLFKDFNRKVISPALKEINQKSDIYIEANFRRSERSIVAVQFSIKENANYRPVFKKSSRINKAVEVVEHKESTFIQMVIAEFNISQNQAKNILKKYEYEYIVEKMNLVRSKKDNIKHLGAYLVAALKQDYKIADKKFLPIKNTIPEISYLREAKEASQIEPLRNKYLSYKLNIYINFLEKQDERTQSDIKHKFEEKLKSNTEVFRFYKKSGFLSPFVKGELISFIDKNFPEVVGEYLSFDDYITSEEV